MLRRLYGSTPRHNFHILDYHHILSLKTSVMTLKHDYTDHTFVHLERDDPHLVHGIAIRTPVTNDKGIPHILEHLVLCGSTKYPVRDPFFKMLNRSMASYMNAWTAADYTFYPFSAENEKDFRNLRDIYADAVFNPLLKENDFMQEGWRLDQNKANGEWEVKGVVYNEMKGALSDIDCLFLHQLNRVLYKDTPYEYNSGGEPPAIPLLSLKELQDFYKKRYTSANSLTVCYGNIDLEEQLKFLDETLPRERDSAVVQTNTSPVLKDWKRVEIKGTLDPSLPAEKQVRYVRAWLCNDVKDVQETFDLKVLSSLLLDGPAAPLHQALLESHFGTDYAPGTGYDSSSSISSFGIGLQGLSYKDLPRVEALIQETLERVAKEGFPRERIEGVLHQMSLELRYHSAKFGLGASATIASAWAHGIDLSEALDVDKRISDFTKGCLGTDRLQKLVQKYLLGNSHGLDFVMTPCPQYNSGLQLKESALVKSIVESKTEEELEEIKIKNGELEREQMQRKDDYHSVLPILKDSEIPAIPRHLSIPFVSWLQTTPEPIINERYANSSPLSNQITYLKLLGIQRSFSREDLNYLPLAINALTELGIKGMSTEEYEALVKRTCGGLSASAFLHYKPKEQADDLRILLSTRALDENSQAAMDLLGRSVAECNWEDKKKVRTLIGQMAADALGGVASSGHRYAALKAACQFGAPFQSRNAMGGLEQVFFLQRLLQAVQVEENLELVCGKLQAVVSILFTGVGEWRSAVVKAEDSEDVELNPLLKSVTCISKVSSNFKLSGQSDEMSFPFNSNYVAVCYHWPFSGKWTWDEKAAWLLLCGMLRSKVLHPLVREQGGAYGSGASMDTRLGLLSLTSYRDPSPESTLSLYRNLPDLFERLESLLKSEQAAVLLGEAKLGVMQGLDAPVDLARQGMQRFMYDVEDADVVSLRTALLSMSIGTLVKLMPKLLTNDKGPVEHVIMKA